MKRIVFIGFILLFLTFSQGTANANIVGDLWDFTIDVFDDILNAAKNVFMWALEDLIGELYVCNSTAAFLLTIYTWGEQSVNIDSVFKYKYKDGELVNYKEDKKALMQRYLWVIFKEKLSQECRQENSKLTDKCLAEIEANRQYLSLEGIKIYFDIGGLNQEGLTLGSNILLKKSRSEFDLDNDNDFALLAHEIYHVMQARAHGESIGEWICGYFDNCIEISDLKFKENITCDTEQKAYRFQHYVYTDLKMDRDGVPNCKLDNYTIDGERIYYLAGSCDSDKMIGCDKKIYHFGDSLFSCIDAIYSCRWGDGQKPSSCNNRDHIPSFCNSCIKLLDLCPFDSQQGSETLRGSLLDSDDDFKGDYCDKCNGEEDDSKRLSAIMDIDNDCSPDTEPIYGKNQDNCRCNWENVDTSDYQSIYNRAAECLKNTPYYLYNPDQSDIDGDYVGDKCDTDIDGDGIVNDFDDYNPMLSLDLDRDGYVDYYTNYVRGDNPRDTFFMCVDTHVDNHGRLIGKLTYRFYPNINPFCIDTAENPTCLSNCRMYESKSPYKGLCDRIDNCPRFTGISGAEQNDTIKNYKNFVRDWVGRGFAKCEKLTETSMPNFIWRPENFNYGVRVIDPGSISLEEKNNKTIDYQKLYRYYFGDLQSDCDKDGIGDLCDTDLCLKPDLSQRIFFPTSKGMISTKAVALDVAGSIYSTGFNFINYDKDFNTIRELADYSRTLKDSVDITIGACPCEYADTRRCIYERKCIRPDDTPKAIYYNEDSTKEYKSKMSVSPFTGIRWYNPLYTDKSYYTYKPKEMDKDICLGINDLSYKKYADDSSKRFCIRKEYIAGESNPMNISTSSNSYPTSIDNPRWDIRGGWDFRSVYEVREDWLKEGGLFPSFKSNIYPWSSPVEYNNPTNEIKWYTQIRIGWSNKYTILNLNKENPPDGIYNRTTYTEWQPLTWREAGGKMIPAEDDKMCRGDKCSPVNEKMNEIEVRFGGCNPLGSYFYLVDAGVDGRFGVLRNPLENSVKMVFKSENNPFPSGLRDYTQIIEVGTLKELGFGDDERERGIIFIYGGIDGNGDVHNDLYVGYENGTDENMMKKIRWVKIENTGDVTPPYAVRPYLFYDRENKQLVVGDGTDKHDEWVRSIYRYNFDGGYWDKTDWKIPPEFYEVIGDNYSLNTAMAHDKRYNVVWGFGGVGRDGVMGWVWRVDLRTYRIEAYPEWMYRLEGEDGVVTNGPGARERMAIYYDGYGSKVYLLGGRDKDGNLHNDIWSFDIDSKKWEKISGDSDNLDRVMDGVLVFDRYKNVLSHTRGVRVDGTVSPLVHFDIFNKKWIKLNLNQNYFVTDNEIISGDYNPYNPPVMKYVPSGTIPLKTGLKSVKMVNSTEGLNLLITDRRNNLVGRGLRMSPEEYVVLAVDKDEDYNLDVVTTAKYSDELVHSYEIDIKDGVIGDKYWEYKYGGIRDVKVRDGYAYIVGMNGLRVVDIKNKREVYKDKGLVMSEGIEIRGDRGYIAQGVFGVAVLDISNPERVEVIGREFLIGYSRDIKVDGDFAYISTGVFGVQVVDISNDREPRWVGNIWVKDVVMETEIYNRNVVVNGVIKGVRVVDMNGNELAKIRRDKADEMRLYGGKVHIRDKEDWEVYDIRDISSVVKLGEYSNSESILRYEYTGRFGVLKTNKGIEISEVVRR